VTRAGRTSTEVERLDESARVDELMRMLSGARTENARRLAMDLVSAARSDRKREQKRPAA
jgi:DNA repair ATPase RecN